LDKFFWTETLKRLNIESPGREEAVEKARLRTEERKKRPKKK